MRTPQKGTPAPSERRAVTGTPQLRAARNLPSPPGIKLGKNFIQAGGPNGGTTRVHHSPVKHGISQLLLEKCATFRRHKFRLFSPLFHVPPGNRHTMWGRWPA